MRTTWRDTNQNDLAKQGFILRPVKLARLRSGENECVPQACVLCATELTSSHRKIEIISGLDETGEATLLLLVALQLPSRLPFLTVCKPRHLRRRCPARLG